MSLNEIPVVVKTITIHAQNKSWGSDKESGHSGETQITWVLEHPPENSPWSVAQATAITILARKELQRLLLADSMARKVPPPDCGVEALPGYDEALETFSKASPSGEKLDGN
jgi:hypothetical protein